MAKSYLMSNCDHEDVVLIETTKSKIIEDNLMNGIMTKLSFKKMVLFLCRNYLKNYEKNDKLF